MLNCSAQGSHIFILSVVSFSVVSLASQGAQNAIPAFSGLSAFPALKVLSQQWLQGMVSDCFFTDSQPVFEKVGTKKYMMLNES